MVDVVKTGGMPADIMMVCKSFPCLHTSPTSTKAEGHTNSFSPMVSTHVCPKYPPLLIYNKSYTSAILVSSFIYFV